MRQRILQVAPVPHRIAANQDAVLGVEPAALARDAPIGRQLGGAPPTQDIRGVHLAAVVQLGDAVVEEEHRRRVGEQPVAEPFGAGDVAGLVDAAAVLAEVEDALGGHAPRDGVEVVDPPFCFGVEAGAGWVVLEVGVWFWLLVRGGLGGL